MTQEDKQLLLKDLCARLPYGVIASVRGSDEEFQHFRILGVKDGKVWVENGILGVDDFEDVEVVKPYLRPLSSMTEEELKELNEKYGSIAYFFIQEPPYYHGLQAQHSDIGSIEISEFSEIYDWLNAHHFDYRIDPSTGKTLIESDLAIEAPEGMYEIK